MLGQDGVLGDRVLFEVRFFFESQELELLTSSTRLFLACAGYYAILRLRGGAPEGPLPQHALLQARGEPVHHLLQLCQQ